MCQLGPGLGEITDSAELDPTPDLGIISVKQLFPFDSRPLRTIRNHES
jgi:hypothetical protein